MGRFRPGPGEVLPERVRIERRDGEFVSTEAAITKEGSFVLQVKLKSHCQNRFDLIALDASGTQIVLSTSPFSIVHGMTISDPPLSQTVGVALSDDTVHVYFSKGTTLPARKTFVHQTVKPVKETDDEDILSIPIVQGEFHRAHRNRLIGLLAVKGVKQHLPSGSRVDITLSVDRSGQLEARAVIAAIGQTFEDIVHVLVPTASLDTLEQSTAATEKRWRTASAAQFAGSPALVQRLHHIDELLLEVQRGLAAARGGDADAAQRVHRLLNDINEAIDGIEEVQEWPELIAEAEQAIQIALRWVPAWGNTSEQRLLDGAVSAATTAVEMRNAVELDRQIKVLRTLTNAAYARDPQSVFNIFRWYEENVTDASDVPRAHELLQNGREAMDRGDAAELKTINSKLYKLYPGTPEERKKSFNSGVY